MLGPSEVFILRTLDADGMVVVLRVENRPGDVPDQVTITPPPGYWVEPEQATIDEGRSIVFRLFAHLLG